MVSAIADSEGAVSEAADLEEVLQAVADSDHEALAGVAGSRAAVDSGRVAALRAVADLLPAAGSAMGQLAADSTAAEGFMVEVDSTEAVDFTVVADSTAVEAFMVAEATVEAAADRHPIQQR